MNLSRILSFLSFSLGFFCLFTIGLPVQAQQGPASTAGSTVDLADVPLNRPGADRLAQTGDAFFPSLLGLRTAGAKQIRTKHFFIYYTSAEQTARRIAEIADEQFEKISAFYPTSIERYAPIHVLVDDGVDVLGNAFAVYRNNYIHFWATPLDWEVRGTKNWIRDVFTHELTHIITLKAAHLGWPFSLAILNTNQSNQNPDFNFTLPLYHLSVPGWYAEGIAQFESEHHGGDFWDSHRDMMLRMATLEDDLLSYTDMGVFAKDGFHSEMVYNQGYAILRYAGEKYGEENVRAMAEERPLINFKSAIKKSLGVSANRLYMDWVEHLKGKYGAVAADIHAAGEREGERVYDGGSLDYHPVYSPDGAKMAFFSNEGGDYGLPTLMVMDLSTRRIQKVAKWNDRPFPLLGNRFSWMPDGNKLIYVKSAGGRWDLFSYDLNRKKERRITAGLRGKDPSPSPDGKQVAFVDNGDGSNRLGIVNLDGTEARYLTHHNDGTQYYGPRWSPDGKKILFSVFRGEDRDIALINADATPWPEKAERKKHDAEVDSTAAFPDSLAYANNAGFQVLLRSRADERDPVWLPDGSGFVFSSNRSGVFNLYAYDLTTGRQEQITNLIGGAFVPSVSPEGNEILYAGYHAADYSIYRIGRSEAVAVAAADTVSRDYRSIYDGEDLGDLYDVGRYSPRLTSYGVTPLLLLGPTFIGNRFGLDQLSVGAQTAWGDLLGDDILVTGFTIGKNLKRRTDLNSSFSVYYETGLTPVMSEQKTYAPRLFIGAARQTINSLIDHGAIDAQKDTLTNPLITVVDDESYLISNTIQFLNRSLTEVDEYKDVFTDFVVGTEIGLGRRQAVYLTFSHRRYSENLHVKQVIRDSTQIHRLSDTGLEDITGQIPHEDTVILLSDELGIPILRDQVVMDDFLYRDLTFFKSSDVAATWRYLNFKPAKDSFINPSGGRAITLRYRRINATVTDSLALSGDLNQDNIPDPTDADVSPTLLREDNVKLGINEYIASWNEFFSLPGRTTLALQAFVGYKDKPIKKAQHGSNSLEGAFYYPLRYYLGGLGTLRGYPYFSLSGGKVFFGRASFTFPIFQRADKELPPFFFDKISGSFFLETGATGNSSRLKDMDFNRDAFLTDFGFELRVQMFSHYRLPMFGYFQIAFPTRGEIRDRNDPEEMLDIDNRRIYFGFTL